MGLEIWGVVTGRRRTRRFRLAPTDILNTGVRCEISGRRTGLHVTAPHEDEWTLWTTMTRPAIIHVSSSRDFSEFPERRPGDRSGAILAARATLASAALRWEKQSPLLDAAPVSLPPVQRRAVIAGCRLQPPYLIPAGICGGGYDTRHSASA